MSDANGDEVPVAAIGGGVGGATGAALAAATNVDPLVGVALAFAAGLCLTGAAFLVYARIR